MAFFNADHGFVEALVRGFRSTFLSRDEFLALRECPTLAAMNSVLQDTDFGEIMPRKFAEDRGPAAGAAGAAPGMGGGDGAGPAFEHTKLRRMLLEKAAEEFKMLRAHAVEPLSTFLDLVTHEYMIDMVVSIMHVVKHFESTGMTTAIVKEVRSAASAAHPLGRLDPATEAALAGFSASSSDLVELVRSLLVDTPVGGYFEDFLLTVLAPEDFGRADGISSALSEQPLYVLEHATKRIWLERFYGWCADQGGETAAVMCPFLEEEAALLALSLADNALTVLRPEQRPEVLQACFPAIGPLHPTGLAKLAAVRSQEDIERVAMGVPDLAALWRACPTVGAGIPAERRIALAFRRHRADRLGRLYTSQFHFGPFYAFAKLKDEEAASMQEVANAVAAAEAASSRSGARRRAMPATAVAAAVDGLIIPFVTVSPADAAGADGGDAAAGAYGRLD